MIEDSGDTKRYKLLCEFFDVVEAIETEEGTGVFRWNTKEKEPLFDVTQAACPAFYVFDFQEKQREEAKGKGDISHLSVYVILEYWLYVKIGERYSLSLNRVLKAINRRLRGNTLNGEAQKVTYVGSKFKVDSAKERVVSAEVAYEIRYFDKDNGN